MCASWRVIKKQILANQIISGTHIHTTVQHPKNGHPMLTPYIYKTAPKPFVDIIT